MTTTQQAGRSPMPPMAQCANEYVSEADIRHAAADRHRRLMGGSTPSERLRLRSWSHAPAPLPVLPEWVERPAPRERDIINVASPLIPYTVPQMIMRDVCRKFGITRLELQSARRDSTLVAARHEAMWRMKNETSLSLPTIGRMLGGRDHTTVLYGIRKYEQRMEAALT